MKAFQMSAFFKMGNNPKELYHDEPFCKSTYPNRKALCECLFCSPCFLVSEKSEESSQAPKAAVFPCSLFAVGSSSLACPWNPTIDPPARHLTQGSIAQMTTQTSAQN